MSTKRKEKTPMTWLQMQPLSYTKIRPMSVKTFNPTKEQRNCRGDVSKSDLVFDHVLSTYNFSIGLKSELFAGHWTVVIKSSLRNLVTTAALCSQALHLSKVCPTQAISYQNHSLSTNRLIFKQLYFKSKIF